MKKSVKPSLSKREAPADGKRGRSGASDVGHSVSLHHQRLVHALSLGIRINKGNQRKWQCTDIETQRAVIRSISSFLDCIKRATSVHPLVKDSISDIVAALVWILESKSESIMSLTAAVAIKMIKTIHSLVLEPYLLDLIRPLSSLLSFSQLNVSVSCATALNLILLDVGMRKEERVWEILVETQTVSTAATNIRGFCWGRMSVEFFQEMGSLLSTVLHRWPCSRYSVWSDAKLMKVLEDCGMKDDSNVKIVVLKVYSGIALCCYGTKNILENEEALRMMVQSMGRSNTVSLQLEGFKFANCLATSKEGSSKMMSLVGVAIAKAIVAVMSLQSSSFGKIGIEEMSLLTEACSLALVLCWPGEHHDYFWEQQIVRVLLDLLPDKSLKGLSHPSLSSAKQKSKGKECLNPNFLCSLSPYVWNILGWLAIHCKEDFNQNMLGLEDLNLLIRCACLCFADLIKSRGQICQNDTADDIRNESVSRALLMLVYSPSKYIASKARSILAEILTPIGDKFLKHALKTLKIVLSETNDGMPYIIQNGIDLLGLVSYCALPSYQSEIVDSGGTNILMSFIRWYLTNNIHIGRLNFSTRLLDSSGKKTCCWIFKNEWEGDDALLLFCFWGLSQLLVSGFIVSSVATPAALVDITEAEFVSILNRVCMDTYAPGLKWYAAYLLSFFGLYGFPCKLGNCVGKALNENEDADMQLILKSGYSLNVHGVILATRCPSLMPPEELDFNGCPARCHSETDHGKFLKQIQLSSHVDNQALAKLLEFIYSGYLHTGEELVKKLRVLAKFCNLQNLLSLLGRRRPQWGTSYPSFDLSFALAPNGQHFSDIVMEAKVTESIHWTCRLCPSSVPHVHAHRVILSIRCEYLHVLIHSGMRESLMGIIKVPVSHEALSKLVWWLYTDELPSIPFGCLWENMETNEALEELQPYMELCWLSELWFLEDIRDISYQVIVKALDSAKRLSVKIIKIAADLSLWRVATIAADYLAPLYHQLCKSGELEDLDNELVDMIRAASVQLSQQESRQFM